MKQPGELKQSYDKFWTNTTNSQLRTRWDSDFDLYTLKAYDAGKGYISYTSNSPRLLATRCISMITASRVMIRVPIDTLNFDERRIANNVERLMYGMLNINDERMMRVNLPSTIEQLAWNAILRGGVGIRPFIYKNKAGKTIVDLAVWDLYHTSYKVGDMGITEAIHTRITTKEQAEEEYQTTIEASGDVTIYDCWDLEENGIFINDQWVKNPQAHGLDECPVYIIQAGAMPLLGAVKDTSANVKRGESIYSINRDIYPSMNRVLSDYATIVRRGVKTPLGYWSAGGQKTLDQDILQVDKAATVAMDSLTGEKIEPLINQTMPVDAKALTDIISGEEQRGGLTNLALGELGFRLSGFAINQLVADIATVIEPFLNCTSKSLDVSLTSLVSQYAKGGFQDLAVRGRDSKNKTFGMPKAQMIAPNEVVGNWHPEISLVPTMPKDDAQRYQLAHLAKIDNMLSLDTIQDTLIGVDDPEMEQAKMSLEWASNLIINKLYAAYMNYVTDGQLDKAENVRLELERLLVQEGIQSNKGTGQAQGNPIAMPNQTQVNSMENAGIGIPPTNVGLSSDVLPSEQLGGFPGGGVPNG